MNPLMEGGLTESIVTGLAWVCGLIVAAVTLRAVALRRRRRRRRAATRLDVGAVSSDWVAKHRVNRE
jgi:flagellar biosynthesis/type III secretory pathway M-ring protein FliF/YscJ